MKNLLLFLSLILVSLSLGSCKKENVDPNVECVQLVEFEKVWQSKANCSAGDFVVAYGTAQDQAVTGWGVYATSSGMKVPITEIENVDTLHYYYVPTHVANNFERFRYRRKY